LYKLDVIGKENNHNTNTNIMELIQKKIDGFKSNNKEPETFVGKLLFSISSLFKEDKITKTEKDILKTLTIQKKIQS